MKSFCLGIFLLAVFTINNLRADEVFGKANENLKAEYLKQTISKINKLFVLDTEKEIFIGYLNSAKPISIDTFLEEYSKIVYIIKEDGGNKIDSENNYALNSLKLECLVYSFLVKLNFEFVAINTYIDVFSNEFAMKVYQLNSESALPFNGTNERKYEFYEKILTKFFSLDLRQKGYIGFTAGNIMTIFKLMKKMKALDINRFENSTKTIFDNQIAKLDLLNDTAIVSYFYHYGNTIKSFKQLPQIPIIESELSIGLSVLDIEAVDLYKNLVAYRKFRIELYLESLKEEVKAKLKLEIVFPENKIKIDDKGVNFKIAIENISDENVTILDDFSFETNTYVCFVSIDTGESFETGAEGAKYDHGPDFVAKYITLKPKEKLELKIAGSTEIIKTLKLPKGKYKAIAKFFSSKGKDSLKGMFLSPEVIAEKD